MKPLDRDGNRALREFFFFHQNPPASVDDGNRRRGQLRHDVIEQHRFREPLDPARATYPPEASFV